MAIDAGDWTVDRTTGDIRYIGSDHGGSPEATYATVIQFHRWLQGLADDAEYTGDDELDIVSENPSTRSTDNIITLNGSYNIDATAAEHLYDGSVIQKSGQEIYDGIVNFGNADVQIQILQDGAVLTDDWWNQAGVGLNADATQGISHRFMILVRDDATSPAADIDGRKLIGTARRFNYTFSEFIINSTARGNNVLALADSLDLNNETLDIASPLSAGVSAWTSITNTTEGFKELDVDNNTVVEPYYSEWNKDTYTINQFYERMKYLTRDGSAETLYGLSGEVFRGITHEIAVNTPTNTFGAFGPVTWTGGTGQMLAINSPTAPTKMWIQLLTGSAPTNGLVITQTDVSPQATATVNVTVTSRTISTPFIGASTGSALIGAYGVGVETNDLSSSDKLTDLDDSLRLPPNNVTFSAAGLASNEDYIIVGPWDGTATDADGNPEINYDQLKLLTTLDAGSPGATAVVTTAAIPTDTPSTGTIRIQLDSGKYRRVAYTSFTGSTFTIDPTDFSADNATAGSPSKNVFISYLDQTATPSQSPEEALTTESFTVVYDADRKFVVKARDGGGSPIKEFISTGTMGDTGGSITVIRTVDT